MHFLVLKFQVLFGPSLLRLAFIFSAPRGWYQTLTTQITLNLSTIAYAVYNRITAGEKYGKVTDVADFWRPRNYEITAYIVNA